VVVFFWTVIAFFLEMLYILTDSWACWLCLCVTGLGNFYWKPCPRDGNCFLPRPSACSCSQQLQAGCHCGCGICSDEPGWTLPYHGHFWVCSHQSKYWPRQRHVSSPVIWLLHLRHVLWNSGGSDHSSNFFCKDYCYVYRVCDDGSVCRSARQQFLWLCQFCC